MVKSKSRCEAAATRLGLKDRVAYGGQNQSRPHGCIYASNKWLIWQNPIGHPYESALCGSTYRKNKYNCICGAKGNIRYISIWIFAHIKIRIGELTQQLPSSF